MLRTTITSLLKKIRSAFKNLVDFLVIVVLGIVAAILVALPWLLRIASLLIWLAAGYIAITNIEAFYGKEVSSHIPVLALKFAVILLMVAWGLTGMMQKGTQAVWGFLAAGGLTTIALFSIVLPKLFLLWPVETSLVLRVFPSSIFSVTLIYMTLRLKSMQNHISNKEVVPSEHSGN